MPELPEVEVIKNIIEPHAKNQRIETIWTSGFKMRSQLTASEKEYVTGRTILNVFRKAKYLVFEFEEFLLLIHFGMSGRLLMYSRTTKEKIFSPKLKHIHVCISFELFDLYFQDPRRFGGLKLVSKSFKPLTDKYSEVIEFGIEPLDNRFSEEKMYILAKSTDRSIKALLMDGKKIGGIGNIYATESLFRAGIHPKTVSSSLGLTRCSRLVAAIKYVLAEAIKLGGSTINDFSDANGEEGRYTRAHLIYGRVEKKCLICKYTLSSVRQNQRRTVFCLKCQNK
ncbi:MAG: DNA-formamidopyrimidine glycosylase [Betaproteobacteria bacterium TMED82]|nr:MAG: DNA-formamidopyrimidine glycosylase [Betaproteobacteria bacterium TMED82]|tara:strand:+ start:15686 stop:16531 length:846 start_codon:yes stop_codon:yes gene_type:complete